MHLFRSCIVASLACALLGSSALSQEYFPLLENANSATKLPADQSFVVSGLRLGATTQETDQALAILADGKLTIHHVENSSRGLSDRRNNKVLYTYGRSRTEARSHDQSIWISYTSGLLGNRVSAVSWSTDFDQHVDMGSLQTNLFEKYGQPNSREESDYSIELRYTDADGIQPASDSARLRDCRYMGNKVPIGTVRQYQFKQEREDQYPGCNGAIHIEMVKGARDDLAKRIKIRMWDYDLVFRNLVSQDQFLQQALTDVIDNQSGAQAPKF